MRSKDGKRRGVGNRRRQGDLARGADPEKRPPARSSNAGLVNVEETETAARGNCSRLNILEIHLSPTETAARGGGGGFVATAGSRFYGGGVDSLTCFTSNLEATARMARASTQDCRFLVCMIMLQVIGRAYGNVLNVGEELRKETIPLQSGSRIYQLQGLRPSTWYEVKISYPASIPASFSLQLKRGDSDLLLKHHRKLLNTEKLIFKNDDIDVAK
ncbi:hypothetical protein SSX86_006016 [Deinandra increscens subsp. villosa]|uniref:Uncharacterized protein n=1 Tax=Deinandra increscens subsp. villosa TaxID=3103831 RepID=A0AAP0DUZ5_9ASTR